MQFARPRGILLIEAMVSFTLFMLTSIFFYGLLANSRAAQAKAEQTIEATAYARDLMEGARLKGYSSLSLGSQTGSRKLATSRRGVTGQTVLTSQTTVANGPVSDSKSILVTVSWNQGRVSMETYVTP